MVVSDLLSEEQEPTFEALKECVDEILTIEKGVDHQATYQSGSYYPTNEAIKNIWQLLAKASNGAVFQLSNQLKAVFGGIAISPEEAFLCIYDFIRTSRFIAGTCAAIKDAQKRFPGQKIRMVDAGCGPFALLSITAMTQFSPDEVEFTLIDVFESSLDCVKEIIKTLKFHNYAIQLECDDAATIQLKEKPHAVVAEVIDRALTHENQVPILLNLAPQMLPEGIFVPEKIDVHAILTSENQEFTLGRIASITQEVSLATLVATEILPAHGIQTTHSFPVPAGLDQGSIFLSTDIKIFGDYGLKPEESAITKFFWVGNFSWDPSFPRTFTLSTVFGGMNRQDNIKGKIV